MVDDQGTDFAAGHLHVPLTQNDQALWSARDSGYDLGAAVGELVDNAYEAGARNVRIRTIRDKSGSIVELGVADDGMGIPPEFVVRALSIGYSSRYDSRTGLGRFGVGLKLASFSQARRIELYTRTSDDGRLFASHVDLARVRSGEETDLSITAVERWPEEFEDLMANPAGKRTAPSGTLVIWRDIDRLQEGGRFGTSVSERVQGLRKFLARAYRRFIDAGLGIELDGQRIGLHDPLFLLDNVRVAQKFPDVGRAEVIERDQLDIDGHLVKWTVTLLPRQFRERPSPVGRSKGREGFADLNIPDNESRVSVLRNGREIHYDLSPKLYPGTREGTDRFIGVEIEFPAELDEYFQVRTVKRGFDPVSKLREELRKALEKPIKRARKSIRAHWSEVRLEEGGGTSDQHLLAYSIADTFGQTAPLGKANPSQTPLDVDAALMSIAAETGFGTKGPGSAGLLDLLRESFEKRALTIVNGQWPGRDLVDIRHLGGKTIVAVNDCHPFLSELIAPLKAMAKLDSEDLDASEVSTLLNRLSVGIDLLFMAYAKAESMHEYPDEAYGELRAQWGLFASGLIGEATRQENG